LFTIVVGRIKIGFKTLYSCIWGFNKTGIELAAHLEANLFYPLGIVNENANENYSSSESFGRALRQRFIKHL
jgi:hypothetical protein